MKRNRNFARLMRRNRYGLSITIPLGAFVVVLYETDVLPVIYVYASGLLSLFLVVVAVVDSVFGGFNDDDLD